MPDWYTVLGFAAALGAILIKAETDLVDVARARSGLVAATEEAAERFASRKLALARRAAAALRFHRIIQAVELSILAAFAAVWDHFAGGWPPPGCSPWRAPWWRVSSSSCTW